MSIEERKKLLTTLELNPKVDICKSSCVACGQITQLAFSGSKGREQFEVLIPCSCTNGPPQETIDKLLGIMWRTIEYDLSGRNQYMKEKGLI